MGETKRIFSVVSPKVLIAFYSKTGVTEQLAKDIAAGANEEGAEVRLRRAREVVSNDVMRGVPGWLESAESMNQRYEAPTESDAEWADVIIFGSPSRFGAAAAELKAYIDSLGGIWSAGKLNGRVASAFASSSSPHGGNEATILSLFTPAAHLGMIIVPLGYEDPGVFEAGTPYGSSAVSFDIARAPTTADSAVARFQGRRVTQISRALQTGIETVKRWKARDGALDEALTESFPASDPVAM